MNAPAVLGRVKQRARMAVVPGDVIVRAHVGDRRAVALTFDDGPNPYNTPAILELLAAHGAKATFFVIGRKIDDGRAALVRRIVQEGHELGNHTYHHTRETLADAERVREELRLADAAIERAAGVRARICRPPFGSNVRAFAAAGRERNQRTVLWSVDAEDWRDDGATAITTRALDRVRPGEIILLHDSGPRRPHVLEATERILESMSADGYSVVTVSDLLGNRDR